ncbi:hypothetical protein GE061_020129, partial [Apolygus lucorum]
MFVDGPQRWDIIQGAIGNCWFVSALASICGYPKLVERIIPDSQTFYKDYCDFGSSANGKEEFWSSIIEKAYAKFYGCYENLHGGRPSSGLLDLTGGISEWYQVKALPPNFHTRLLKYRNSNCILSCGIMGAANAVAEEKID